MFLYLTQSFFESHLARQRCYNNVAAVMLQTKHTFHSSHSQNSLFCSADLFENYLVTEMYCVRTLEDSILHLIAVSVSYSFGKKGMKKLFDKLFEVHLTDQFVDWFYTDSNLGFNDRVCTKERDLFDIVERAVNFNRYVKKNGRLPSVAESDHLGNSSKNTYNKTHRRRMF